MSVNTDRGLPPVRLEPDRTALGRPSSGSGARNDDGGFKPLSSIGNLNLAGPVPAAPSPAPKKPKESPRPDTGSDPKPAAYPAFTERSEESSAPKPKAPAPATAKKESPSPAAIPVAEPAAPVATAETEAGIITGETPAPAPDDKPHGLVGRFIRRVW